MSIADTDVRIAGAPPVAAAVHQAAQPADGLHPGHDHGYHAQDHPNIIAHQPDHRAGQQYACKPAVVTEGSFEFLRAFDDLRPERGTDSDGHAEDEQGQGIFLPGQRSCQHHACEGPGSHVETMIDDPDLSEYPLLP